MSATNPSPAKQNLEGVAVLIPARQPHPTLLALVPELIHCGFSAIIVVDDGNGPEYQDIFEIIAGYPEAHLIQHAGRQSKGRALKSGMSYFLNTFPDFKGVITTDADGRHTPEDILLTTQSWTRSPQRMIVGARRSSGALSWRKRLENQISRYLFSLITGGKLTDTPCGLYAMPRVMIPELLTLPGEHGAYELAILAHACRSDQPPVEALIRSVGRERSRSPRVYPVRDFLRCCLVLFRRGYFR